MPESQSLFDHLQIPVIAGLPPAAVLGIAAAAAVVLVIMAVMAWRSRAMARDHAHAHAAAMSELADAQADTAVRMEAMIGLLSQGQSQLQHLVNERLEFGLAPARRFAAQDHAEHRREPAKAA